MKLFAFNDNRPRAGGSCSHMLVLGRLLVDPEKISSSLSKLPGASRLDFARFYSYCLNFINLFVGEMRWLGGTLRS